jgi:hypothetical protein
MLGYFLGTASVPRATHKNPDLVMEHPKRARSESPSRRSKKRQRTGEKEEKPEDTEEVDELHSLLQRFTEPLETISAEACTKTLRSLLNTGVQSISLRDESRGEEGEERRTGRGEESGNHIMMEDEECTKKGTLTFPGRALEVSQAVVTSPLVLRLLVGFLEQDDPSLQVFFFLLSSPSTLPSLLSLFLSLLPRIV